MELCEVYQNRPFKIRNADEFDLENVLNLFVDPTDGLSTPFDYENSIIKGKMGSGKTMYLRANQAYYSFTMVPSILAHDVIVLPVYIKLSDFQLLREPEEIYSSILIKILEELTSCCHLYLSASNLVRLHNGFKNVSLMSSIYEQRMKSTIDRIKMLTCEEYIETVSKSFGASGQAGNQFLNACASYSKGVVTEIKGKGNVKFGDIIDAYNVLLKPFNGKILLLFDEVGSLNKSFFKEDGETSAFESLMNQLRTLPFLRTKIAIYPNSPADILTETRYGDKVELENLTNENQYPVFLTRTIALIGNYLQKVSEDEYQAEDIFDIDANNYEILEQMINASNGNMRRLVHLLDMSMNNAYKRHYGQGKVNIIDVTTAMKDHAHGIESIFSVSEIELLSSIAEVCRTRGTYRFSFPNKSVSLIKYTSKSEEYNVINLIEVGTGRKSNVFEFDYAYCVYKDIPTHYQKNTERIDKSRSLISGERIRKITKISDELIQQSLIPGKIEGKITFVGKDNNNGFIRDDDEKEYFFMRDWIIQDDRRKPIKIGSTLRFVVLKIPNDDSGGYAREIEVL